jgi:GNAT superfamily N-acetyltransferase
VNGLADIRPLVVSDYADARVLYVQLVGDIPVPDGLAGQHRFAEVLGHPGTTVWGAVVADKVVAMATVHILPNMTFGGRPYAMIENVVTRDDKRGTGLGAVVMRAAIGAAWAADAYKIMLLTGRTLGAKGFYERLGFTDGDKHGMTLRRAPPRNPQV